MLRKRLILTAGLLLAATGTAAAAPAVVTNDLNLRSGPGINHHVTHVMPAGQTVDVQNCSGNWCHVSYAGTEGYASIHYLGLGAAEAATGAYAQATGGPIVAIGASAVVSNDLNLRSGPGTKYRVLHVMPAGETVAVQGCTGNWCQVTYGETAGYASSKYLGLGASAAYAQAPVTSTPGYGWGGGLFGRPYYRGAAYGSYYRGRYYGRPYYRGGYYGRPYYGGRYYRYR